jgi:hypothetical protein
VRLAVIVEMRDGELPGEFEQRTHVVAVVVRGPQVIDLGDASGSERIRDAPEGTVAGVAGIHQQRLAGRTDEERRLPAFRVDVVDRQRFSPGLCGQAQNGNDHSPGRDNDSAHA